MGCVKSKRSKLSLLSESNKKLAKTPLKYLGCTSPKVNIVEIGNTKTCEVNTINMNISEVDYTLQVVVKCMELYAKNKDAAHFIADDLGQKFGGSWIVVVADGDFGLWIEDSLYWKSKGKCCILMLNDKAIFMIHKG